MADAAAGGVRNWRQLHRPRFYRYRVADPGARVVRNLYRNDAGSAFIGMAVVAGRFAYCVKWADAKLDLGGPAAAPRTGGDRYDHC